MPDEPDWTAAIADARLLLAGSTVADGRCVIDNMARCILAAHEERERLTAENARLREENEASARRFESAVRIVDGDTRRISSLQGERNRLRDGRDECRSDIPEILHGREGESQWLMLVRSAGRIAAEAGVFRVAGRIMDGLEQYDARVLPKIKTDVAVRTSIRAVLDLGDFGTNTRTIRHLVDDVDTLVASFGFPELTARIDALLDHAATQSAPRPAPTETAAAEREVVAALQERASRWYAAAEPTSFDVCGARDGQHACQLARLHAGRHACPDADLSAPVHEWPQGPRCKNYEAHNRCYLDDSHTGPCVFVVPPTPASPEPQITAVLTTTTATGQRTTERVSVAASPEPAKVRDESAPHMFRPNADHLAECPACMDTHRYLMAKHLGIGEHPDVPDDAAPPTPASPEPLDAWAHQHGRTLAGSLDVEHEKRLREHDPPRVEGEPIDAAIPEPAKVRDESVPAPGWKVWANAPHAAPPGKHWYIRTGCEVLGTRNTWHSYDHEHGYAPPRGLNCGHVCVVCPADAQPPATDVIWTDGRATVGGVTLQHWDVSAAGSGSPCHRVDISTAKRGSARILDADEGTAKRLAVAVAIAMEGSSDV